MNLTVGMLHQGPASSKRSQEVHDAHTSPNPRHNKTRFPRQPLELVIAVAQCSADGTLTVVHGMFVKFRAPSSRG